MFLIRWLAVAGMFLAAANFLSGVYVKNFLTALLAAVMLSIINLFIKPVVIILTLPINLLTLGLFTFVINALMVLLVSAIIPGFVVNGFLPALALALIITVINHLLS